MNILIPDDYQKATLNLQCRALLQGHHLTVLGHLPAEPHAEAALQAAECLVLIRERTPINQALLQKMPKLKLISQTGPAGKHINMAACTHAGVAVVQGTGLPSAPAELTWLLIMSACRRLPQAIDAMKQGHWQTNIGRELNGQTLAILGFGKLGQMVAAYGKAFGMKVQVWGSERGKAAALAAGYEVSASRQAFFVTADVLSLHVRLVDETRGCVLAQDLAAMKPSAILVNTSRAELIASGVLETALQQGRPGFAALDVFENEPIYNTHHPLLSMPNVLCTPHLGYVSEQNYEAYFGSAFQNILQFYSGDYSRVLNPQVL